MLPERTTRYVAPRACARVRLMASWTAFFAESTIDQSPGGDLMQRLTAQDFHPEVLRWFDKYIHGVVDRRGFFSGVSKYAVGGMSAVALLEALSPNYALGQV